MANVKKEARLAETKRKLAEKYQSLARTAGSQPKRQKFRHRAEKYFRQAELLAARRKS